MIKIVGIEFIPRLGNGRPENGTGTFVEWSPMKYWEIRRWQAQCRWLVVGYRSAVTKQGWRWWIVDAPKGDGKRYIVQSDELLSAFLELQAMLL